MAVAMGAAMEDARAAMPVGAAGAAAMVETAADGPDGSSQCSRSPVLMSGRSLECATRPGMTGVRKRCHMQEASTVVAEELAVAEMLETEAVRWAAEAQGAVASGVVMVVAGAETAVAQTVASMAVAMAAVLMVVEVLAMVAVSRGL